jgi:hypothetical protein
MILVSIQKKTAGAIRNKTFSPVFNAEVCLDIHMNSVVLEINKKSYVLHVFEA